MNSHSNPMHEVGIITIPILQDMKQGLRKVVNLPGSHSKYVVELGLESSLT
jgi:hypothetical protein